MQSLTARADRDFLTERVLDERVFHGHGKGDLRCKGLAATEDYIPDFDGAGKCRVGHSGKPDSGRRAKRSDTLSELLDPKPTQCLFRSIGRGARRLQIRRGSKRNPQRTWQGLFWPLA